MRAWLGIGLDDPLAFPDFERFCSKGFPVGTPIEVCCVYRFRHVRVRSDLLARATDCVSPRKRNCSRLIGGPQLAIRLPSREMGTSLLVSVRVPLFPTTLAGCAVKSFSAPSLPCLHSSLPVAAGD